MKAKTKKYLEDLKEKMNVNEERIVIYKKKGTKLVKVFSGNKTKEVSKLLKEHIKQGYKEGDRFLRITYAFYISEWLYGPLSMTGELLYIDEDGDVDDEKSKVTVIHYTLQEIESRGFKTGDYKKLYNRLNNGTLESGMKKIYNAKHLD